MARSTQPTGVEATAWIDTYLAPLPDDQRMALQALRRTIRAAAPEAEETISYGMPAIRHRGRPVVSYLAAKAHCSLFPMSGEVTGRHRAELEGFATAKGTIRFTPEHPLPDALVRTIVRERIAEIEAKTTRSRSGD